MDLKELFVGGGAAEIGKLIKGLTGGDLDLTQIPSFARLAGLPEDEICCLIAATEAYSRDLNNPKRHTRSQLQDLVYNFDEAGPEHYYYIAFRLIEVAHAHFAAPIKEREEQTDESNQSTELAD